MSPTGEVIQLALVEISKLSPGNTLKIPFRNATFFVKNTMKNTAGEA
jgi:hypothetical protein